MKQSHSKPQKFNSTKTSKNNMFMNNNKNTKTQIRPKKAK